MRTKTQVLASVCADVADALRMLPDVLRLCRTERKLTLRQAADELGITEVWLCNLETGKRKPSLELIERIGKWAGNK